MPANLNVVLGLTLQVVDNAATTTPVNSANQGITLGATVMFYDRYFQAATTATTIPLPGTTVWYLYVRNMGTNVVTLSFTPTGGAAQTVDLCPVTNGFGGVFMLFQTVETGKGIVAASLTASGGVTSCEVSAGF
jgi:hypothetical protein